jgi:ABC-type Zn uptake system ZnuABC Zn-binding protein ZnuA
MRRALSSTLVIFSWLLAACTAGPLPADSSRPLKVVATYSILGDLVQTVGQDKIELRTLVGPGQDTHTFEPSPSDGVALVEADLIFENGLEYETWLDDLYAASGSKAERVVVTAGLTARAMEEEHEGEHEEEHGEERGEEDAHGHEHGAHDPHVWHSAANAIQMVKNIRDALAQADPENAEAYEASAGAYIAQLQDLDTWVFAQVRTLPQDRRKLVTTHDTFGYFAARYGFEVIGTVLPTTTEGAAPSAQELAALVETVKAAGVPAIFAENVSSNALLNQVANEAGVKFIVSLYTDALGPPGSDGDTYLKMMRSNVTKIVTALSP